MTDSLLLVGDIHLGRVPTELAADSNQASRLGPAEAWRRTVELAIDRKVSAVILAGDVVEHERDRFEAWGHLRFGVERLVESGIAVLGVAGNHDAIALPKLADRIPDFHLVGRGGTWECVPVGGFDVVGWSFPASHYRDDPLTLDSLHGALAARRSGALTIGVLHADMDATSSNYAPVSRIKLRALGLAGVFLGHIHVPSPLHEEPVGYLGSLVGLDRSEVGPHGPWLVSRGSAGRLDVQQVPLGPVHWMRLEVSLEGVESSADGVHEAIFRALRETARSDVLLSGGRFEAVGVEVALTGRADARDAIRALGSSDALSAFSIDQARWVVVRLRDNTLPTIDVETIAQQKSPAGIVAALLLALDRDGAGALPSELLRAIAPLDGADVELRGAEPVGTRAGEIYRRALSEILGDLLAQQAATGGAP